MAPHPRVLKALSAMRVLGISKETVVPVLKKLLKLYDYKWELIEEDNYRTLADAIFECADDKKREDQKKDIVAYNEPEPPLKYLQWEQQEDGVSSTVDNANIMLDREEEGMPPTSIVPRLMESSHSFLKDRKPDLSSRSPPAAFRDKGKGPISSNFTLKVTTSSSERTSSAFCSNQARDGAGFGHMPREKRHKDCSDEDLVVPKAKRKQSFTDGPLLESSSTIAHSVKLEDSSTGDSSMKELVSPHAKKDKKAHTSACSSGATSLNSFEMASSPSGEVKISLNCNSSLGQPNFHAPNLDSVLKFVETKYLRSYKIVGSQFSVIKLLKDLCDSYLELGTDSTDRSFIRKSSSRDCRPFLTGPKREGPRIGDQGRELITGEATCPESSNSCSLVVPRQIPTGNDKKRSSHKLNDLTKGTEKVRISLLDETGNENFPKFVYIPQNTIYQNAYIHFSLARIADDDCCSSCLGDCLSSSVTCACARETGGEFAYTSQGLLKEKFLRNCISMDQEPQKHYHFYCTDCPLERAKNGNMPGPCKGHLVRKFIKECWRKCGCDMHCGNRVVQRGITSKLQVFATNEGKGWGLRTLQDLPEGAFVCEYAGEILTNMELYERNKRSSDNERHTYPVLLDADWSSEGVLKDDDALCLDATFFGNVARFINHRCYDANLLEIPVEVETPDHHYYHLAFFTKRKVNAFEEMTWDYGIDFDDHNHPIKAFQCFCGSTFCRDKKGKGCPSRIS